MSYLKQTENTNNFLEVLVRDHKRYMPVMEFLDNVTFQDSELTVEEREQIAFEVSKTNKAQFCMAIHHGVLNALSPEQTKINQDKLEPILAFVRKLVNDSSSITKLDVKTVTDEGWSDQTVEDVIGIAASITTYDILANGFGFKNSLPDKVFDEMGKATLKQGGFVAQFESFIS